MNAVSVPTPHDNLEVLLRHLLDVTEQSVPEEDLRAAVREAGGGDWAEVLERALPVVGLQGRWMRGTADALSEEVRSDMPLATWLPGPGGGWAVIQGGRLGAPEVVSFGRARQRLQADFRQLFGSQPRDWVRIVPLLPVSALDPGADPTPIRRLLGVLRAERQDIAVVVLLAIAIGLFSLATPLAIQLLINWLAFGALLQPIITLGIALLLCLGLVGALRAVERQLVEVVQRRLFVRSVTDISARLARMRVEMLDTVHGPELANRFFDVVTVQKATSSLLLDGLAAVLQALVGATLLAFYHPALLAFDAVAVLFVGLALVPLGQGAVRTAIVESKKKYAVAAWLEELAGRPLALRTGGGRLGEQEADRLTGAWLTAREQHFRVYFRQYLGLQAVMVLLPVLLLVLTGWLVLEGQLTLGQLVAAEFVVTASLTGILKFTEKLETVYDLLAGIDKVGNLLDVPLETPRGSVHTSEGASRLTLEHVDVAPAAAPAVLHHVELELKPRARHAILGCSGSGKSLLAEVVVGARRPSAGVVSLDGVPMGSIRPRSLADGAILARPDGIFAGTLRDNLTLGAPVPDKRVWEVLGQLGLDSAVRAIPGGLDCTLLHDGRPLCTSDLRGVIVARAMLAEPGLVVLDSLLDALPASRRDRWLDALVAGPWTLLVLTRDPVVAQCLPKIHEIREGTLHDRPRLTTL